MKNQSFIQGNYSTKFVEESFPDEKHFQQFDNLVEKTLDEIEKKSANGVDFFDNLVEIDLKNYPVEGLGLSDQLDKLVEKVEFGDLSINEKKELIEVLQFNGYEIKEELGVDDLKKDDTEENQENYFADLMSQNLSLCI